jgi:mannose-6-phosphate isomerase-like protein (cupin superfamily)
MPGKQQAVVVNLAEKFALFTDQWHARIVGEINDTHVKLARIQGEFLWHSHAEEDELFLVVEGELTLKLRDRDLLVRPGEFVVVPRGVEHMPVADEETKIMMIEPAGTVNTGGNVSERTVEARWV